MSEVLTGRMMITYCVDGDVLAGGRSGPTELICCHHFVEFLI